MRRTLIVGLAIALTALGVSAASAHQPVNLLASDTTAAKGPLLVDGTVSFAVRATFSKSGQKQAFRAALKAGDQLAVQYLIVDKKPESALKSAMLPQLIITAPSGKKITIKMTERTPFFEPYGGTNYLYLARYSAPAEAGIYQFVATARAKAAITIAVGDREVRGEVLRGAAPTATPTVTPTPASGIATPEPTTSVEPTPEITTQAEYTMANVAKNNSTTSCWSLINGNVYNLTGWINSHPGGASRIRGMCGRDGSASFNGQHRGQGDPTATLASYLLGPLAK